MIETAGSSSQRRLRIVAALAHGPVVIFALFSVFMFVHLGGLSSPASTIGINFGTLAILIAARLYWLKSVWAGVIWGRRRFFDVADIGLAVGLTWQNGFGGYEREWGAIALPLMLLSAFASLHVHRALREAEPLAS